MPKNCLECAHHRYRHGGDECDFHHKVITPTTIDFDGERNKICKDMLPREEGKRLFNLLRQYKAEDPDLNKAIEYAVVVLHKERYPFED